MKPIVAAVITTTPTILISVFLISIIYSKTNHISTRDELLTIATKKIDEQKDRIYVLSETCKRENNELRRTNLILGSERDTFQSALNSALSQLNITQAELDELYNSLRTPQPGHYIVSHHPRSGYPWIVERWWFDEQLWVPLKLYHNRITAFDVRDRLNSGELKPIDLLH
jgi:hypothetical protein